MEPIKNEELLEDELSEEELFGVKAGMNLTDDELRKEYEDYIRNLGVTPEEVEEEMGGKSL